jgi:hypothetical protein
MLGSQKAVHPKEDAPPYRERRPTLSVRLCWIRDYWTLSQVALASATWALQDSNSMLPPAASYSAT